MANKIDRLLGELLGTQAAVRALIAAQPDSGLAAKAVRGEIELLIALAEEKGLGAEWIEGLRRAKATVLPGRGRRRLDS